MYFYECSMQVPIIMNIYFLPKDIITLEGAVIESLNLHY